MLQRTWVDETVEIAAPADAVHSLLWDVQGWPAWTRGLRGIRRKSGAAFEVGTRFVMVFERGIPVPCEIFEFGPARLEWGGKLAGSVVRHSFEITPLSADRCRLRHLEYATGVLAALAIPIEKALRAYDHRWTETIRERFALDRGMVPGASETAGRSASRRGSS